MFFLLCGVITPILLISYNIFCYLQKKVNYMIKDNGFIIIDDKFFSIQLALNIVSAILMSILMYAYDTYNFTMANFYVIVTYWGINYFIKYIGILNKYAEIRK